MKNYTKCKNLLGEIIFNELIENLLNHIVIKFSKDINIEDFVKILDININTILLLSNSNKYNYSESTIIKEFNKNSGNLIIEDINEFRKWADKYIKLIIKKL